MSNELQDDNPVRDEEVSIESDGLQLFASPWGASLRGLLDTRCPQAVEVITCYTGHGKVGGQGDVLIPFPGRVADGRYRFDGVDYQMKKNDSEAPNAIHGFLRSTPWTIVSQEPERVAFAVDLPGAEGYPFDLHTEVAYSVGPEGMSARYSITNIGQKRAPVAAGFHPYLSVNTTTIDLALLELPFSSYLEYNANLVPTGRVLDVAGTPLDFRRQRAIGTTMLNTCFLGPQRGDDGKIHIKMSDPEATRAVTLWLGEEVDYVVLYSGDPLPTDHRRRSLAIEPMTCASDAFNHPEWGLLAVEPEQTIHGGWGVAVHD